MRAGFVEAAKAQCYYCTQDQAAKIYWGGEDGRKYSTLRYHHYGDPSFECPATAIWERLEKVNPS